MELEAKKRRRSAAVRPDGGADYISALPDAVLGDIISLLPTKEGARTRILASRWRHLWLTAPLNLSCCDFKRDEFALAVPLILSTHQGPGRRLCIHTYRCLHIDNKRNKARKNKAVEACLGSSSLSNLQELELKFSPRENLVSAPVSVFRSSSTLHILQMAYCTLSDATVHQGLRFPLLKRLGLYDVEISDSSLNNMVAGCPTLECLMIHDCQGAVCLRINSLCLTSIGFSNAMGQQPPVFEELVIESAPRLEKLLIFNDEDEHDLHVSIISAPNLESLYCTSSGLVFGSKHIQGPRIDGLATMAPRIKYLALKMWYLTLDDVVQKIVCFPFLEKLYVECDRPGKTNAWHRKHRSLDIRLKEIKLSNYEGRNSDADFVTFFVLNVPKLESMTLAVPLPKNNKDFIAKQRQKLQLENRVSACAQFHFIGLGGPKLWGVNNVSALNSFDPFG